MEQKKELEKIWPEEKSALKSPWVRGLILLMVLFFSVNVVMVLISIKTKPDLVAKNYYERGQSFTERSKIKRKTRKKSGWKFDLVFNKIKLSTPTIFSVSITVEDKIKDIDEINLFAYRPSNADKDFHKQMNKTVEGNYQAELLFTEPGYWDIIVVAKKDEQEDDFAKRIYVTP